MSQLWHIFKKDVRYLRLEICLLFILALLYAQTETRYRPYANHSEKWSGMALMMLALFIIASVVQAEAVPGDKQFWITRPYRWKQLLAAKIVFIIVFVNGPLLVAQLLIIRTEQFPILANWAALLWTQVLFFLCILLPAAALCAITSGLVSFVLSIVGIVVINVILMPRGPLRDGVSLIQMEWVRIAGVLILVLASTVVVLIVQYRYRRTLQMRIFAAVASVLVTAVYWTLPFTVDLEAQTHSFSQPAGVSSIQILLNRNSQNLDRLADVNPPNVQSESVSMKFPLALSGIPAGTEVHIDALAYDFEAADGRRWRFGPIVIDRPVETIQTHFAMDSSFFNAAHNMPVTLKVAAYLTLFGNAEEKTVAIQPWPAPTNITPQVQCYGWTSTLQQRDPDELKCRMAFREPAQLFYASLGNEIRPLRFGSSYSPFPATLNLNPVLDVTFSLPLTESKVTFIMKQQVALRRDLEVRDVHLDDFVVTGR